MSKRDTALKNTMPKSHRTVIEINQPLTAKTLWNLIKKANNVS